MLAVVSTTSIAVIIIVLLVVGYLTYAIFNIVSNKAEIGESSQALSRPTEKTPAAKARGQPRRTKWLPIMSIDGRQMPSFRPSDFRLNLFRSLAIQ